MAQGLTDEQQKKLQDIAATCGTRFVRVAGFADRFTTRHPVAWKNALWMAMRLDAEGFRIPREARRADGDDRFYVYAEVP